MDWLYANHGMRIITHTLTHSVNEDVKIISANEKSMLPTRLQKGRNKKKGKPLAKTSTQFPHRRQD